MANDGQLVNDGSGDVKDPDKRTQTKHLLQDEGWSRVEFASTKPADQGTIKSPGAGGDASTEKSEVKQNRSSGWNSARASGEAPTAEAWNQGNNLLMPVPIQGTSRREVSGKPAERQPTTLVPRSDGSESVSKESSSAPNGSVPTIRDANSRVDSPTRNDGVPKSGQPERVERVTHQPNEIGQKTGPELKGELPGSSPKTILARDTTPGQQSNGAIVPSKDVPTKGETQPGTLRTSLHPSSESDKTRRLANGGEEQPRGDRQGLKPGAQNVPLPTEGFQRNLAQRSDQRIEPVPAEFTARNIQLKKTDQAASREPGDTRNQPPRSGTTQEYLRPRESGTREMRDTASVRDVTEKSPSGLEASRKDVDRNATNLLTPNQNIDGHSQRLNETPVKHSVKAELAEPIDSRLSGNESVPKPGQARNDTANGARRDIPRTDAQQTKFADTPEQPTKKTVRADGEPGSGRTITSTKGPRIEDVDFVVGDRKGMTPFGGRGTKVPLPDSIFENIGGIKSGKGRGDTRAGDTNFGDPKTALTEGKGDKSSKGDRFPGKGTKVTDVPGESVKDIKSKGDGSAQVAGGKKTQTGDGRSQGGDGRGGTGRSQPGDVADGREGVRAPKGIDGKGQGIGGPRGAEDGTRRGQTGKGMPPGEGAKGDFGGRLDGWKGSAKGDGGVKDGTGIRGGSAKGDVGAKDGAGIRSGSAKGEAGVKGDAGGNAGVKGERGTIADQIEAAKARFDDAQSKIREILKGKDLRTIDSAGARQNDNRPHTPGGIRQDDFGPGKIAKPLKGEIGAGFGSGESGASGAKGERGPRGEKSEVGAKIDPREPDRNIESSRRAPKDNPGKGFNVRVDDKKESRGEVDTRRDPKKPGKFVDGATKVNQQDPDIGKQRKEIPGVRSDGVRSDGAGGVFIPSPNVRMPDIGIRIAGGKSGVKTDNAPTKPGDIKPVGAKQTGDTKQSGDTKLIDAKLPGGAKQVGDAKTSGDNIRGGDSKQSGNMKPAEPKQSGGSKQVADAKESGDTKQVDIKQSGKDARIAANQNIGGLREAKDAFGGKLPTIKMTYGSTELPPRRAETDRGESGRVDGQGSRTNNNEIRGDIAGIRGDIAGIRGDIAGIRSGIAGTRSDVAPPADTFVPLKGGIASDAAVKGSFETKPTTRMEVDPAKAQIQSDAAKPKDVSKSPVNQEPRDSRGANDFIHHAKGITISGGEGRSDRRDVGELRNDGSNLLDESKGVPRSIRDVFIKYRLPLAKRSFKPDITDSGTYRVATGQSSQRLKALASSAKLTALKSSNDSSASLSAVGGQGESESAGSALRNRAGDASNKDEEPRKWHIVKEGEDERFIASAYLNDESLASLIKEINKPVFRTVYDVALQQNVDVLPVGAMILLPNAMDIEEFRTRA